MILHGLPGAARYEILHFVQDDIAGARLLSQSALFELSF
jgi:hypothetical protein